MEPSDKQCVVIEIILQRVKQTGNMVVWVRSQGWCVDARANTLNCNKRSTTGLEHIKVIATVGCMWIQTSTRAITYVYYYQQSWFSQTILHSVSCVFFSMVDSKGAGAQPAEREEMDCEERWRIYDDSVYAYL